MKNRKAYEVIIVGGSYAGLSAAMSLGRSLIRTLVIDSGNPCNAQTPHAHNFLTRDGHRPKDLMAAARAQVAQYVAVAFHESLAISGLKTEDGFEIRTQSGEIFTSGKLIFATGLKDVMPDLAGFAACWGISILHCPYCHGFEVRGEKTGIIGNGDFDFEFLKLISNWTGDLTIFMQGQSTFTGEQLVKISAHHIAIVESEIRSIEHTHGRVQHVVLKNGLKVAVTAIYAKPKFEQHCQIPLALGCALTDQGLIRVDAIQKTTVDGVFACGDNSNFARAISLSVSSGSMAGVFVGKAIIDANF